MVSSTSKSDGLDMLADNLLAKLGRAVKDDVFGSEPLKRESSGGYFLLQGPLTSLKAYRSACST